ncbi:hypothetical protein ABT160_10220 [Streptomyces sp. NPDC001941]|uniref:hypothetical protein n=1 Tax=Streptomyces sp. NPDC001941 TaxID=3154659 RepID=UPI00331F82AD
MTPRTLAARPDDLVDYGRFLHAAAQGGPSGDNGLDAVIELVAGIALPVPDERVLPGGAQFARGLGDNVARLLAVLRETATGYRDLGRAVEHIGTTTRDAEGVREAGAKALGSKLPRLPPPDASPLAAPRPQAPTDQPAGEMSADV